VASFGPPRYLRAATGSLVDAFEPRIRELLRPFPRMPVTANRGADRLAEAFLDRIREDERGDLAVADLDCDDR
jgi:hypothetical protein